MRFFDLDKLENDEVRSTYLRKIAYGESLTVAKVEVQQGEVTQTHSHDSPLPAMALRVLFGRERMWLQFVPLIPGIVWLVQSRCVRVDGVIRLDGAIKFVRYSHV